MKLTKPIKSTWSLLLLAGVFGSFGWGSPAPLEAAGRRDPGREVTGRETPGKGEVIRQIQVQGIQRVEAETVKSYLEVEEGRPFDEEMIRRSIKALYQTGFFKDVAIDRSGGDLVVRVEENPMISEIVFTGSDTYTTEDLAKMIQTKAKSIYNKVRVERDLGVVRQAYRNKGLFLADVESVVKPQDQNRVQVVFQIKEGDKSKVDVVRFIGNHSFSERDLSRKLMIHSSNWLSFFSEDDTYDREKLLHDQEELRLFYLNRGYAKVRVDSSVAELTPDRRGFVVTHVVHEGERFRFGKIALEGDFAEMSEAQMREVLTTYAGDWFSREALRKSVEKLSDAIGDFGYAFLSVNPVSKINDEEKTVDIAYKIAKGKRVYLNRIDVVGNTRTKDAVIRREMRMAEGDRFSASQMRRSKERLKSLNFFETVDVATPVAGEDRVNTVVKVVEKSTGTFTLGAGYSSTESVVGTASVSQNNFLGNGQQLSFSVTHSARTTNFDLSFTEPYFMDKDISAGFDLYNKRQDRTSYTSYKQDVYGGAMRFGFNLSEHLHDYPSYYLSHIDITDLTPNASFAVLQQANQGPYWQSMLSNSVVYDTLDNRQQPTTGQMHRFTTDVAGVGGGVKFGRVLTEGNYYRPLFGTEDYIAHVRGKVGWIEGFSGDPVPVSELYFLGGNKSVRGFKAGGIGPRTWGGDSYGGNLFEQVNVEMYMPFMNLADKGVRAVTFMDMGNLGITDDVFGVSNNAGLRLTVGAGLQWNSPFGPLRVDMGLPLVKQKDDVTRILDFTVGM